MLRNWLRLSQAHVSTRLSHVTSDSIHIDRQEHHSEPESEQDSVVPEQHPNLSDEDYRYRLIDLIDEIDETKRDIKAQIHSRNIAAKEERTGVNQVWLRKAKDKIDHLTRERAEVRNALHVVNERIKEQRRAEHSPKRKCPEMTIGDTFMQVAKDKLDPEVYDAILNEASAKSTEEES